MGEFWNMAYSVCKAIDDWYWGGFDGLLSSLAVFIVTVHITNGMCAIFDRRPIGRADVQEIFKSALIFILVGIGNILDTNVLTNHTHFAHGSYSFLSFS